MEMTSNQVQNLIEIQILQEAIFWSPSVGKFPAFCVDVTYSSFCSWILRIFPSIASQALLCVLLPSPVQELHFEHIPKFYQIPILFFFNLNPNMKLHNLYCQFLWWCVFNMNGSTIVIIISHFCVHFSYY